MALTLQPRENLVSISMDWLLQRVVVAPNGCMLWTGATSGDEGRGAGYAKVLMRSAGGWFYVHRLVYASLVAPIQLDQQVDHLCARWVSEEFRQLVRRCCCPWHLDAVPPTVNQKRKFIRAAA